MLILFCAFTFSKMNAQNVSVQNKIDKLLKDSDYPFNGNILITENNKVLYKKTMGLSDLENKKILNYQDCFVIGSISKQFTAALILMEYDKGTLDLFTPIKKYLPEIKQTWTDSITVHHLLTHTHGIETLDKPLLFEPGTSYAYSQIGYDLLAEILEKVTGKEFSILAKDLFEKCGMKNTFHPDFKEKSNLVKGYTKTENKLEFETNSFQNFPAAGSFISNVEDLSKWNSYFFEAKLFKKKTFKMMTTKQKGAIRQHPIFGQTEYGYGITIDTKDGIIQYGQTGFAPGFVSMNFYFPKKKRSVIVLQNIVYDEQNLKKSFFFHTEILKNIRAN